MALAYLPLEPYIIQIGRQIRTIGEALQMCTKTDDKKRYMKTFSEKIQFSEPWMDVMPPIRPKMADMSKNSMHFLSADLRPRNFSPEHEKGPSLRICTSIFTQLHPFTQILPKLQPHLVACTILVEDFDCHFYSGSHRTKILRNNLFAIERQKGLECLERQSTNPSIVCNAKKD